jgi:hypothetical protein
MAAAAPPERLSFRHRGAGTTLPSTGRCGSVEQVPAARAEVTVNLTVVSINALAIACLIVAFSRDRTETAQAVRAALRSGAALLPTLLLILVVIGLTLGFVTTSTIGRLVGEGSGPTGIFFAGLLGSVLHIPALLAFPLGASFLRSGATTTVVAVFITTLTMVGLLTLPQEIQLLARRFALLRNALSPRGSRWRLPGGWCAYSRRWQSGSGSSRSTRSMRRPTAR